MGERIRLDRLTSLRFFAALVVVLHHVTRDLGELPGVTGFLSVGTAGVGFFFALSGFVLTWSYRPDDTRLAFYRRRFARIYPLHLVTFIIALVVVPAIGDKYSALEAVTNVTLLQAWAPWSDIHFGLNAPSWSLSCELFFYVLFPFFIGKLKTLSQSATLCAILTILTILPLIAGIITFAVPEAERYLLYVLPAYRVLGFLAGCLLANLMLEGWRPRMGLAAAILAVSVTFIAAYLLQRLVPTVGHGVEDAMLLGPILLLIAAAADRDLARRPGFLTRRWLVRLGEWSFALYLTHWLLLEIVEHHVAVEDWSLLSRLVADALFVGVSVALSALAYIAIERPLERLMRGGRPSNVVRGSR